MNSENKATRIYGIDPGSIKEVDKVNNMSELDLWLAIDGLGYHIWYCNHQMSHGRIDFVDLTEEIYAIEYLVYQTKKFGVEFPEPQPGKHIEQTDSYVAWYKFYSNHFKNVLSNEQWNKFMLAKTMNQDLSPYLPQGNWRDLLQKEKTMKKRV